MSPEQRKNLADFAAHGRILANAVAAHAAFAALTLIGRLEAENAVMGRLMHDVSEAEGMRAWEERGHALGVIACVLSLREEVQKLYDLACGTTDSEGRPTARSARYLAISNYVEKIADALEKRGPAPILLPPDHAAARIAELEAKVKHQERMLESSTEFSPGP